MTKKTIPLQHILLISNKPTTGGLWAYTLQQQKISVALESIPTRAVQRWVEEIPDLIILDVNLPARQVTQLIKTLRRETVIPILVLTRDMTEDEVIEAYHAGADECIFKPINPSMLIVKVKAWLRRSWSMPFETLEPLRVGKVQLHPSERTVQIDGYSPVRLTNLELRVVLSLMTKAGRTLSADELIQQIWGYTAEGDRATLKNLVYRLRRKIEDDPTQPRIIQTVGNAGYKLAPE